MPDTFVWDADFTGVEAEWEEYSEEVQERSLLLATSALINLTNRRVGAPPIKVRLCPVPMPCPSTSQKGHDWEPYFVVQDGAWLNACGCSQARWCHPLDEIDLPGPIGYVSEIKVDGVAMYLGSANEWRVDDGHLLVWQGSGPSPIPETQDLNKPDTEVGTWSISYSTSSPVPRDGKIAAATLALEFARATKPKGKCSLPKGVTNVARNGVSFTVDAGMFLGGLTTIETVDQFILKWAPAGSPANRATVFDPRSLRGNHTRKTADLRTGI